MPYIYRKIYIICKTFLNIKLPRGKLYSSYVAKVVFLWKYDEWRSQKDEEATEDNLWYFVKDLLEMVLEVYKDKNLPSYFFPQMNVLQTSESYSDENVTEIVSILLEVIGSSERKLLTPFVGIVASHTKKPYINHFFDKLVNQFSRETLASLLEAASTEKEVENGEKMLDLIGELYQLFLYHLFMQMHYPTIILASSSDDDKFSSSNGELLKEIYQRIHNFTMSVLYVLQVFVSAYIPNCKFELEALKPYYDSVR